MSTCTIKEISTLDLKVTVAGEEWAKAQEKALNKIAKKMELPGFRKGQAPKRLVKKNVSTGEILATAVDEIANEVLQRDIKEHDLFLVAQPTLDLGNISEESVELIYTCTVKPEVKLGEYKGLPYEIDAVEVGEEDINAELNRMAESFAEMIIKDSEAVSGDTVNIDYEGFNDGVPFEGGKSEGYDLVLGSGQFIPGFEDQLIGKKAGEEVEVNVTFPEEYHEPSLAGAAVVFNVKVNEVKCKETPALDDEFAKDVNVPDVDTLEGLKEVVKKDLTERKTQAAENEALNKLLTKVVDNAEVDIPDAMVEDEANQMIQEMAYRLQSQGFSISQFMEMTGQTVETLRDQYKADAEKKVKLRLVLEAICKVEGFEVSEEEIEEEFKKVAEQYGMEVDEVKKYIPAGDLAADAQIRKAYDLIQNSAVK